MKYSLLAIRIKAKVSISLQSTIEGSEQGERCADPRIKK